MARLPDFGGLLAMVKDLARRVKALETAPRLQASSISEGNLWLTGGNITVVDGSILVYGGEGIQVTQGGTLEVGAGSQVVFRDGDGTVIGQFGLQPLGDYGITLSREDGTPALSVGGTLLDVQQLIRLFDRSGNTIFQEDVFVDGIGVPYLEMPMQPVFATAGQAVTAGPAGWERVTTSATFEDVFAWSGTRQNKWYRPVLSVTCSDATTAGEVRVVHAATGEVMYGFVNPAWVGAVPAGTVTPTEFAPTYGLRLLGNYQAETRVVVQARRTAGSGSLSVSVRRSAGGSP